MAIDGLHARPMPTTERPSGRLDTAPLRERHPDEPWRWRPDWASGVIRCAHAHSAMFLWAIACVWNLLSAPILWAVPEEFAKENHLIAVGLLFPTVGVGLLVLAIRETLRWRRYGRSDLVLDTLPGVVGGRFAGTVQLGASVGTEGAFETTLSCVRIRVSGAGKNRSRREDLLWQDEDRLEASACQGGPRGTAVPIAFSIPAGQQPSSPEPGRDIVEWRLDVRATIPGIDYQARFVVPVFRTAESAVAVTDRRPAPLPRFTETGTARRFSAGSRIRVEPLPSGGSVVWFPAFRNPASAVSLASFAVLWVGITAALVYAEDVPRVFGVTFGVFAVLIVWGALRECFRSVRVEATAAGLSIRSRTLLWPRRRRIAAGDIERIEAALHGQHNQRARYDVVVHTTSGRQYTAGEAIPDKREAEWLAGEMERAVRGESAGELRASA